MNHRGRQNELSRHAEAPVLRAAGVVALIGIAVAHLPDLPHKIEDAPYLAFLFTGLVVTSLALALLLALNRRTQQVWVASAALAVTALAGYAVSRSVGLPQIEDHVGHWLDPAGVAAVVFETTLSGLALMAIGQVPIRALALGASVLLGGFLAVGATAEPAAHDQVHGAGHDGATEQTGEAGPGHDHGMGPHGRPGGRQRHGGKDHGGKAHRGDGHREGSARHGSGRAHGHAGGSGGHSDEGHPAGGHGHSQGGAGGRTHRRRGHGGHGDGHGDAGREGGSRPERDPAMHPPAHDQGDEPHTGHEPATEEAGGDCARGTELDARQNEPGPDPDCGSGSESIGSSAGENGGSA
jgi:hypothetical protein